MEQSPMRMMKFHVPDDPALLAVLGTISLCHSHLDHVLRMMIKTLTEVTVEEALDATVFEGSASLRNRIKKLAKRRLGDGTALVQLQALLERCRRATEYRNDLIHSIWAQDADGGDAAVRTGDHDWKPLPTIDELDALSDELRSLAYELNTARLDGFLSEALSKDNESK